MLSAQKIILRIGHLSVCQFHHNGYIYQDTYFITFLNPKLSVNKNPIFAVSVFYGGGGQNRTDIGGFRVRGPHL